MEKLIKIIPLTDFQKKLYTIFVENHQNLISNIKGVSVSTLVKNHEKNYSDNYPKINIFQLNSIPDIINGIHLDYSDKQNILLSEIESVKSYTRTLETFSIDANNNLQYYNLKNKPILIRNVSSKDALTFERYTTPKFYSTSEQNATVNVIPATEEQKKQYTEHWQSLMYKNKFKLQFVPHPILSKEQLKSIPDFIDGNELNQFNKTDLIFGQFIPYVNNTEGTISDNKIYTISDKGEIIKTFEYIDKNIRFGNIYKKDISFVKQEDCAYKNKIMIEKEALDLEVKKDLFSIVEDLEITAEQIKTFQQKNTVELTKEQLEKIPAILDGNKLSEYQKKAFAVGDSIDFLKPEADDELKVRFKLEENGKVSAYYSNGEKIFLTIEEVTFEKGYTKNLSQDNSNTVSESTEIYKPTTKKNMEYDSFDNNLTLKTKIIMSANADYEKAKDLDVVGFERPLKVYDPISILHNGKILQGKVIGLPSNGEIILSISNSKEIKELTVSAKDQSKLQPMFILNKDEKMVYLKFTYEETVAALNKKDDIILNHNKSEKSPVFNLMVGNKTDVIPFEKMIENKLASVEGRLELRRKANSGEAYVHGEIKHKELNLELPIYGLHLNEQQKEALLNKKDIGLVQGFQSKDGKEFALWVSLDEKLNKVVTAPERSININMIFGVKTTEEQREQIKSGQGAIIEIKGKEYLFQASAATTKADGLKSTSMEKKIEKKETQTKEVDKEEKKSKRNSNQRG